MSAILPHISVVFITFNRIETLKPTVETFLQNTDYPREKLQLIAADDGSDPDVQDRMKTLPFDKIVVGPRRSGLSANVNRGLAAADADIVLQIQDDWDCLGPPNYLIRSIEALGADDRVEMILLKEHPKRYDFVARISSGTDTVCIHKNSPTTKIKKVGEHAYTDWPHLKTRRFIETIGAYDEKLPMWSAELDYSRRVNDQIVVFVGQIDGLDVFCHTGRGLSYNAGGLRTQTSKALRRFQGAALILDRIKTWTGR